MSTTTLETFGPALVSELPPVAPLAPGRLALLRARIATRVSSARFDRALRTAGPGEYGDLLAAARRG